MNKALDFFCRCPDGTPRELSWLTERRSRRTLFFLLLLGHLVRRRGRGRKGQPTRCTTDCGELFAKPSRLLQIHPRACPPFRGLTSLPFERSVDPCPADPHIPRRNT